MEFEFNRKLLKRIAGGVFVFALGILLFASSIFQFSQGPLNRDHPDVRNIRYLFGELEFELLDSYGVEGSWAGDIERGFVARVPGLAAQWNRQFPAAVSGDALSGELLNAVSFVTQNLGGGVLHWFPRAGEVRTPNYSVQLLTVDVTGNSIDSSRLLLFRPADEMLFYAWVKY